MLSYMLDHGEKGSSAEYYNMEHAIERITEKDPFEIAQNACVTFDEYAPEFRLTSLGQEITVTYPECVVRFTHTRETPGLLWRLMVLHYLDIADGALLSNTLVPYRDVARHVAHPQIFERTTAGELVTHFADKPLERLEQMCKALGGVVQKASSDLYCTFHYFPRFPIVVKLWLHDDEITGSGMLLFDSRSTHYLSQDDVNLLGPMFVSFLVSQYKHMFP